MPSSKNDKTTSIQDTKDAVYDYVIIEETRMRWFLLRFAACFTVLLIGADAAYAFINHNLSALALSPLIVSLWLPMVKNLFPGRIKEDPKEKNNKEDHNAAPLQIALSNQPERKCKN